MYGLTHCPWLGELGADLQLPDPWGADSALAMPFGRDARPSSQETFGLAQSFLQEEGLLHGSKAVGAVGVISGQLGRQPTAANGKKQGVGLCYFYFK